MADTELKPIAFMSYVHTDDKYGHLTEFRERLSDEVRVQTGVEFPIFQDRNDIQWGQNWEERIEHGIDRATFLIPIITPSFFTSPACCKELERFLKGERKLKRNDLVLPVYYVACPLMDDEKVRAGHELAKAIAAHQWADWRELRFLPFTSPEVGKTLARLALQIRDALECASSTKPKPPTGKRLARPAPPARGRKQRAAREPSSASAEAARPASEQTGTPGGASTATEKPAVKTEPPILVVDPMGRGDHQSISEAIDASAPGTRVLVRPGLYKEGLLLNKPLEIIGDGERDDVVVEASGENAVLFQTAMGRVINLTLRQAGGGNWYCVDIEQGRLELEGCDISSQSLACVAIHAGADPRLRQNRIHDGEDTGVRVYDNGRGTLEDNEIFGNALAGVVIKEGSNPTLRRNRIHDGKQGGVMVSKDGEGVLEDNDIFGNAFSGVEIKEGGNPTFRHNRIHDGKQGGVNVHADGQGLLDDNDIFGNDRSGVVIREGGNPTLRGNRINKNGYRAVWVYDRGGGTFEDNDLRDNEGGAWKISDDSMKNVKRSGNLEDDEE